MPSIKDSLLFPFEKGGEGGFEGFSRGYTETIILPLLLEGGVTDEICH
jgi:hypothetical protein